LIFALNVLGNTDSVLYYSERALRSFKDNPVLYLFYGSAKYQKKMFEDAINVLNKGLSLSQDKALKIEFYSLLAESYQGAEQFDKSEESFEAALQLDEGNIGIKNNYAYYLSLREKNLKLARKMSYATIQVEPDNSTYLDTYAWVLFKSGKVKQAKKFILNAVEKGGSNNKEILMHCGEILMELKEYGYALKYFQAVIKYADAGELETLRKRMNEIESNQ
jgi:Flp pilus assembly protein TadD